jgi:hypothetical protein
MKVYTAASLMLSIFAAASCGGRRAVEIDPSAQPVAARWNGTLSTPANLAGALQLSGQGWMAADPKNSGETEAYVAIANAAPGGVHPWHVHRGQCGADQGILGPADSYKPLEVEGNGRASGTANLPIPLPKTGDFFINVHASAANMGTIVACGNLAPPAR